MRSALESSLNFPACQILHDILFITPLHSKFNELLIWGTVAGWAHSLFASEEDRSFSYAFLCVHFDLTDAGQGDKSLLNCIDRLRASIVFCKPSASRYLWDSIKPELTFFVDCDWASSVRHSLQFKWSRWRLFDCKRLKSSCAGDNCSQRKRRWDANFQSTWKT